MYNLSIKDFDGIMVLRVGLKKTVTIIIKVNRTNLTRYPFQPFVHKTVIFQLFKIYTFYLYFFY